VNPWPFVIGAYGATLAGIAVLTLWSWAAMRRAEREAERLGFLRDPGARP
jgi:heme exporter protein CcmD